MNIAAVLLALAGFFITIGIIVVIHEGGHFLAAKWLGFAIKRFSIGMGKVLWKRQMWGTEFALSLLPIGGYVAFEEEPIDEKGRPVKGYLFETGPRWRRAIVIVAGPLMNFVLAVILFSMVGAIGVQDLAPTVRALPQSQAAALGVERMDRIVAIDGRPIDGLMEFNTALLERLGEKDVLVEVDRHGDRVPLHFNLSEIALDAVTKSGGMVLGKLGLLPTGRGILIRDVLAGGPADQAGLRSGDIIRAVDGDVADLKHFAGVIRVSPGKAMQLEVESLTDGKTRMLSMVPRSVVDVETGVVVGRADLAFTEGLDPVIVRRGPLESTRVALMRVIGLTRLQASAVGGMVSGEVSTDSLSGPVGIANMAGKAIVSGATAFLEFVALISIAIGFMNLVPIPALDGGQLVLLAGETLLNRPIPPKVRQILAVASMGILVLLAVYVTYIDIGRFG